LLAVVVEADQQVWGLAQEGVRAGLELELGLVSLLGLITQLQLVAVVLEALEAPMERRVKIQYLTR
jgi:hypothetical protein